MVTHPGHEQKSTAFDPSHAQVIPQAVTLAMAQSVSMIRFPVEVLRLASIRARWKIEGK
jgi:hypothetical protein